MLLALTAIFGLAVASPAAYNSRPDAYNVYARQTSYNSDSLQVDLGYEVYGGYSNATAGLNIFQGIRFAAPPVGELRWQAPQAPATNRSETINASSYAPICPQSLDVSTTIQPTNETGASEDCLFLNVWSPSNATSPLPVLVWIHGGGYGAGSGRQDLTTIINTNGNSFVGVTIQYRLGAFGFLSSDEVYRKGVVNAGLLDQHLALQWVQKYIHLFNGDPNKVTIAGESAGGGSVMLQDMSYGGSLGTQLFINSIAASPYLPMQYGYKDWVPSQSYYSFASEVGCAPSKPYLANGSQPIFECLVSKDSETLINASALVSQEGSYGTWAFLPVTDGVFVQDLPSRQLARGAVNGLNILSGNNADEGSLFTPQNILTEDDLVTYLRVTFPLFSNNDIAKILYYYPTSNDTNNPNDPPFATEGDSGATALNQSSAGTGQQQRANLIYGETTFVCPSYWLAEAYSSHGGSGYKYQFSVPPARHGSDVSAYFGTPGVVYTADFDNAFQKIFGDFITTSNPSISDMIADGQSSGNSSSNPASTWPPYSIPAPYQLDLNTTCAEVTILNNVTYCDGPLNEIRLVDAYSWEAGRGTRCDFWKSVGELVPE